MTQSKVLLRSYNSLIMTENKHESAETAKTCLTKLREIEGLTIQGLDCEGLDEKHAALQKIQATILEVFEFPLDDIMAWIDKVLKDYE